MQFDIRKLAEDAGLKYQEYDTALPLDWYEDVHEKTGFWPQSYGFVWSYGEGKTWGVPYPLTEAAKILLQFYEKMTMLSHLCEKHDDCYAGEFECEFNPKIVRNVMGLVRK